MYIPLPRALEAKYMPVRIGAGDGRRSRGTTSLWRVRVVDDTECLVPLLVVSGKIADIGVGRWTADDGSAATTAAAARRAGALWTG